MGGIIKQGEKTEYEHSSRAVTGSFAYFGTNFAK